MLTRADIESYFNAEKNESLVFIVLGILALVVALLFIFYWKSNWHRGAAIPFILVGLLHLVAGITIFNRSDQDRIRVVYALDMHPSDLTTKELPRMQKVNSNFVVYRYTEIALLILGLILYFYFRSTSHQLFWAGLGMALAIEAGVSLGADYFAEQRAKKYTELLVKPLNPRRGL